MQMYPHVNIFDQVISNTRPVIRSDSVTRECNLAPMFLAHVDRIPIKTHAGHNNIDFVIARVPALWVSGWRGWVNYAPHINICQQNVYEEPEQVTMGCQLDPASPWGPGACLHLATSRPIYQLYTSQKCPWETDFYCKDRSNEAERYTNSLYWYHVTKQIFTKLYWYFPSGLLFTRALYARTQQNTFYNAGERPHILYWRVRFYSQGSQNPEVTHQTGGSAIKSLSYTFIIPFYR